MNKPLWMLPLLLPIAGLASAQSAGTSCPYLSADTGLTWEHRVAAGADFCRALRADGTEAFGLNISKENPFKPKNANRAERSTMDGKDVVWYRAEIAGTKLKARETLMQTPDGRVAHIWVQAKTDEELTQSLQQTQSLRFEGERLSSN
ncbi:hypothetical protein [Lysobacter fragariae]